MTAVARINEILQNDGVLGLISRLSAGIAKHVYTAYYRMRLKEVGKNTFFEGPVNIRGGKFIRIGNHCVIQKGVTFQASLAGTLEIENECFIGQDVLLNAQGSLKVLSGTHILKGAEIISAQQVRLGPNAWIARDCKISGHQITLGQSVILGPSVSIVAGDHEYDPDQGKTLMKAKNPAEHIGPVEILEGSWIGTRSVILKNVVIGPGSIVGAGAVVTKSLPAFHLGAGVPARVIKRLR